MARTPLPCPKPFIVLIVFRAYLAWDFLEVIVQENWPYIQVLISTGKSNMLPPPARDYTEGRSGRPVRARRRYNQRSPLPYHLRSPDWIAAFFTGLDLVEPGVGAVLAVARPGRPGAGRSGRRGVARKP